MIPKKKLVYQPYNMFLMYIKDKKKSSKIYKKRLNYQRHTRCKITRENKDMHKINSK